MSNEPKASMNLDPEMLAAYIDNRLTPEQRAEVEAQLARDPDSYTVLVEAIKALDEIKMPAVPKVPGVRKVRRWAIAAGVLATAAALVLVVRLQPDLLQRLRGERVDPQLARLVAAVGEERYFEPRLTGGFKYGPLRSATRGSGGLSQQNLELLAAAGELQKQAAADATGENLHAWGMAQLLIGDFDAAVATLEEAARSAPQPMVQSDLAAAYLARGLATSRAEDLPRALASASRAIAAAQSAPPEALFNRALAADRLNLRTEARRYWQEYLDAEPRPEWREYARSRLDELDASPPGGWLGERDNARQIAESRSLPAARNLAARYPQQLREFVEDVLLPEWGVTAQDQPAPSLLLLEQASTLAKALSETNGDQLVREAIDAVVFDTPANQRKAAKAFASYGSARTLYERSEIRAATPVFAAAGELFAQLHNPFAEWADLHLAIADYYTGNYGLASQRLTLIASRAAGREWRAVTARSAWMRGLIAGIQADYVSALAAFREALAGFELLHETDNQAAVHGLIGNVVLYVGDGGQAWTHTVGALQSFTAETPRRRRHTQLVGAANLATRMKLPEAALSFEDEAQTLAREWKDPVALVEVTSYRARTLAVLGRFRDAEAESITAKANLATISDPALLRRIEAEVMQTEAEVMASADPVAGMESATRAINFFSANRSALRVPRLYAVRAAARQALGDLDGAADDLAAGASRLDAERQSLPRSEIVKLSHGDDIWRLYTGLLEIERSRGRSCEQLLESAERGRRTVSRSPSTTRQTAAEVIANSSHDGRALLHYSFQSTGALLLVVYNGRCSVHQLSVTSDAASALIARFVRDLQGRRSSSTGSELFNALLSSAWPEIKDCPKLDIVADGALHMLPFAALTTPGGKFLIEVATLRILPSATDVYLERARGRVANAVISGSGDPIDGLPELPGAAAEAALLGELFAAHRIRVAVADTVSEFVRASSTADIVHFSGHAVANPEYPLLSTLLFSSRSGHERLTAEQISQLRSRSPHLVFLSACSTQSGRWFGGEGPASLARAFLMVGAREVVATLWPVDDLQSARVVRSFYSRWFDAQDAATALRAALLTELQDPEFRKRPYDWAAWLVIGNRIGATVATN